MDKVKAKLIIEIMGRPAEHIQQALSDLVDKMGTEKGIKLIDKKINEPIPVEKAEGFFTSFAELDVEFETVNHFFGIIFNYMPAHVEIYEPESFKLEAFSLNEMSNYILTRLHRNDGIMKTLLGEREMLTKQLEHLKNGGKIEDIYSKQQVKQTIQNKEENKKQNKSVINKDKEKKEISKKKAVKNKKKK